MAELNWTVDGRRFRNQEEYMAAKRDKQLIDSITGGIDLNNSKDIEYLYLELKAGKYNFESVVGRQFDDNIYELYKNIKEDEAHRQRQAELQKEKKKEKLQKVKSAFEIKKQKDGRDRKISFEDMDKAMQMEVLQVLKRKEKKRRILTVTCVFLCIVCFGYLGIYYSASAKSAKEFEELVALKEAGASGQAKPKQEKKVNVNLVSDQKETPDILPEYQAIHSKNQKLIGWVKIDDTIIDYPVMQTVNNEYYLNHNFNQEEDNNGCIFMDYQCDVIEGCDNIILYGHHMKSGKMFGTLNKYSQKAYYDKHPVVKFDTIYEKGEYQIMYVFRSRVYSEEEVTFKYYQFFNADSEKEFQSYMNEMAALSLYDTGVSASYGDRLLTLSTCDYQEDNGRFVVVAKKVG